MTLPEILRFEAVKQATGLSRSTIWRLERAGLFPRHVQLTPGGLIGWIRADISNWIVSRCPADRVLSQQVKLSEK